MLMKLFSREVKICYYYLLLCYLFFKCSSHQLDHSHLHLGGTLGNLLGLLLDQLLELLGGGLPTVHDFLALVLEIRVHLGLHQGVGKVLDKKIHSRILKLLNFGLAKVSFASTKDICKEFKKGKVINDCSF